MTNHQKVNTLCRRHLAAGHCQHSRNTCPQLPHTSPLQRQPLPCLLLSITFAFFGALYGVCTHWCLTIFLLKIVLLKFMYVVWSFSLLNFIHHCVYNDLFYLCILVSWAFRLFKFSWLWQIVLLWTLLCICLGTCMFTFLLSIYLGVKFLRCWAC